MHGYHLAGVSSQQNLQINIIMYPADSNQQLSAANAGTLDRTTTLKKMISCVSVLYYNDT